MTKVKTKTTKPKSNKRKLTDELVGNSDKLPSDAEIKRNAKAAERLEKNWQKDLAEIRSSMYQDEYSDLDEY